ncbi:MAG: hypothetical protein AAGF07_04350 [Patescibacteria group bacterium]
MNNVARLIAGVIIIGLVGYTLFWTVSNWGSIFSTTSTQTIESDSLSLENSQQIETDSKLASADLPEIRELLPRDNFITNNNSVVIEGQTDASNEVTINDQEVNLDNEGKFAQNVVLKVGANKISLRVKDPEGKENVIGLIYTRSLTVAEDNKGDNNKESQNSEITTSTPNIDMKVPNSSIRTGGSNLVLPVLLFLLIIVLVALYPKKSNL